MKITGLVTTVFRDAETLEIIESKTQENHIQEEYFKKLLNSSSSYNQSIYDNIFLSSENPGRQRIDWEHGEINFARTGSAISGVPDSKITLDYAPGMHLKEMVKRFGAPAVDTDINMIGLCSSVVASTGIVNYPNAVVWLSETVTQKTTEILDIFYRVQVTSDAGTLPENFVESKFGLSPGESRKIANAVVGENGHDFNYYYSNRSYMCWHSLDKQNFRKFDFFKNQHNEFTYIDLDATADYDYGLLKNTVVRGAYTVAFLGHAISWVGASTDSGDLMHPVREGQFDPVQSVFGHNSLSNTPFYNSNNSNLGLGKIEVNGTGWTNPDTGKYVFIDVKNDGLTGTSTYKFRIQPFFGFDGNTWTPKECYLPSSTHTNKHISSGFAIGRDDYRHSEADPTFSTSSRLAMSSFFYYKGGYEVLFLWKNEFAIIDVITGEAVYPPFNNERLFGVAEDPEFLAENIIQHYVLGDFIYIACGVTGLYRIHPANDTIEKIDSNNTGLEDTTGCYGICEGFGGRLYAYFNHTTTPTIYYSDDNGVSWVSSGMSDSEFSSNINLVMGIQASKTESDGHLAIIYRDSIPDGTNYVYIRFGWYNLLTNAVTKPIEYLSRLDPNYDYKTSNAYIEHSFNYSEAITCSPNQGKWAVTSAGGTSGVAKFYTFEGSSSNFIGSDLDTRQNVNNWIIDKDGNDAIMFLTGSSENGGGAYGSGNTVVVSNGTTAEYYGLDHNSSISNCLYLKDGLWLHAYVASNADSSETQQSSGYAANYLKIHVGLPANDTYASPDSTYGLMAYPVYGWNGTSWEANHPDGKPTHAGHEELFDGVTMAWDDIGGTKQFLASDHYTTAIFNGIVMDGATSFEFESTFYVKEVIELTDVESPTLPTSQKISNVMAEFIPQGDVDFQDLDSMNTDELSGSLRGTGNGLDDDYTGRARSANVVIEGGSVSFLPNKCFVPDSDINNALGWVETDYYTNGAYYHAQTYFGISDASVLGTVIDPSTIQYGMHFDSEPNNGGSVGTARLSVIESGIERAFVTGIVYDNNQRPEFRIILLNTGVMVYEYKEYNQSKWTRLYESPSVGMVPLVEYYLDVAAVPRSNYGLENLKYGSIDPNNSDYFVYFGNGVDSGLFDPEFRGIDTKYSKIYIDGQEAVVMDSDMDTVLGSNRVSIFPYDGVMRYSGDDVGKTISVSLLLVKL